MGVRVATTFATLGIAGLAASPGERSVCAALKSSLWPSQHPLSICAITAMSYICHPREVEGEIGRSLIRLRPISSFDFELEAVGV